MRAAPPPLLVTGGVTLRIRWVVSSGTGMVTARGRPETAGSGLLRTVRDASSECKHGESGGSSRGLDALGRAREKVIFAHTLPLAAAEHRTCSGWGYERWWLQSLLPRTCSWEGALFFFFFFCLLPLVAGSTRSNWQGPRVLGRKGKEASCNLLRGGKEGERKDP